MCLWWASGSFNLSWEELKKKKSKLYHFCSFIFNGRLLISLKKINCKEAYKREKQAKDFI